MAACVAGIEDFGTPQPTLQAQLGAEAAFPRGNAEHSEYGAVLTSLPAWVSWLCTPYILSYFNQFCKQCSCLFVTMEKDQLRSFLFAVLYFTTSLLAVEISEYLCIGCIMFCDGVFFGRVIFCFFFFKLLLLME